MVKYKNFIFLILIIFFLVFSFYPTFYELSQSNNLFSKNREFILEHNYYWPDFNLYLSKVRQGYEGRWLAQEKYTTEKHQGSLIQIFYLFLGKIGSIIKVEPNFAYQIGRIILSPLLLIIIFLFVQFYFKNITWQILAFLITIVSGSFPKISFVAESIKVERFMEWWSNIDALQRITFIPHILFGQVISFYLLYKLTIQKQIPKYKILNTKYLFFILLANLTGLVFPPSLITLLGVISLLLIINLIKYPKNLLSQNTKYYILHTIYFIILSLPSLLYLFIITKQLPWSALVDFHRTHPMMIPLDQYVLGTGPIIYLGFLGGLLSIIKRNKKFYPQILWVVLTFLFASFFSIVKEQSPLRFTQTGLFIPLGILGAYFFKEIGNYLGQLEIRSIFFNLFIILFILENLFIMQVSLQWQLSFIKQRVGADRPPVPYPPQTMYPLTEWMDGIRWLKNNTRKEDPVLAEITAGNFIPAYAGNFVYFGQSNTVNYDRKISEVDSFFQGKMSESQAQIFLKTGRIKYIFFGIQEKERLGHGNLEDVYPFLGSVYHNPQVNIYQY